MLTRDDVRAAALALPEAYEEGHFDKASFRVANKIFCTVHLDEPRIVLKLDPEDQHNLLDGDAVRPVEGAWGRKGWTYAYFERLQDGERLKRLLRLAWSTVAPKRLLKSGA
ncbi:MmcQ/YjbR family DNA-binding protein [Phenylobacterium sp. VNQ135]|uniref:MmcQ/YjbR family DNA-binding protein n=1 Tax=Phenylobacterium sp. VNQ135 TaxID=3400922 RepID=UPI003C04B2D2